MSEETIVPELTKEIIKNWSGMEMRAKLKDPLMAEKIEAVMNAPDEIIPDPAEVEAAAAAEAEALVIAQKAEEDVAAQAEADRLAAEASAKAIADAKAIEDAKPKKIVVEYQTRDDDGTPIGNPTHIEGLTWEEVSEKQTKAHEHALRYANRLKKQKTTFKQEQPPLPEPLTQAELLQIASDMGSGDESKIQVAKQKLDEDSRNRENLQLVVEKENVRRDAAALKFMRNHVEDFNPCAANANILSEYLETNNLDWTADNLELAFVDSVLQLAPKLEPAAPVIVPPVENTTVAVTSVLPAAPVAETVVPVAQPAPVINTPVTTRRVPDGGLQPGQFSGTKPASKPAGLTKLDIKNMDTKVYRQKMKNPAFVKQVNELFAKK